METEVRLLDSVSIPPDVVFRELDGEAVLLNLQTGVYFGLNEMGTRIWDLIQQDGSLAKTADAIEVEYDVARETLEGDLLALIGELASKGLVHVQSR